MRLRTVLATFTIGLAVATNLAAMRPRERPAEQDGRNGQSDQDGQVRRAGNGGQAGQAG